MASQQQYTANDNAYARGLITTRAIDMIQGIYTNTFTTGPGTVINIPIRNVGLIKRFFVQITATCLGNVTNTAARTTLGPQTFLSNVTFTDLSNQTRINTTGIHLSSLATAKRRYPFGSAATTDTPLGYGSNFTKVIAAPSAFPATATNNSVYMFYEIPLSYSDKDLRGAIYANVTNATMNLQLTVNPNLFVASGTDATFAMYQSAGATLPVLTTFAVTVYQNYLDQLPVANGNVVLPLFDLSTAYLLNNTSVTGLVANQDNPIPYANYRDFYSTLIMYDNAGTLNVGSDINYFSIQSANYTNILKYDPYTASLLSRNIINDDFPAGTYYFDHRNKPITTQQYGNMQLIVNPSVVTGSTSQIQVMYEALALINMITQAGSLYGN